MSEPVETNQSGSGAGADGGDGARGDVAAGSAFGQTRAHVAVLDPLGRILAVNRSWVRFGEQNGLDPQYQVIGDNYLQVCFRAVQAKSPYADPAWHGVMEVLAGIRPQYALVYPCHGPAVRRYFNMTVVPKTGAVGGAVVSHVPLDLDPADAARVDAGQGMPATPAPPPAPPPSDPPRYDAGAVQSGPSTPPPVATLRQLIEASAAAADAADPVATGRAGGFHPRWI